MSSKSLLSPEDRWALARAPLPPIRAGQHIPGKSWAGVLISDPVALDYGHTPAFSEEELAYYRGLVEHGGGEYHWLDNLIAYHEEDRS